jgi:hypothetical protein
MPKLRRPRIIAPRLASGERRIGTHAGLPPNIKHAAYLISISRNQSVSWALEQLIIKGLQAEAKKLEAVGGKTVNVETPEYIPRKKSNGAA